MASIIYCDYLIGDDATGSGTNTHPYKTINQASTSLTGGDEVRVAKGPAITTLSGTLAWVDGAASITTSEDLTGQLSQGDFVGKDTAGETWWEVITIVSGTLTMYRLYSGTTETVASKKLGIISTGQADGAATQIQIISSSGSSVGNELKISGGWDLSTETQDGQTYFRQMHGTFATRNGYGLHSSGKSYLEIEKLNFLRYYLGLNMNSCSYNILNSITSISNEGSGIYLYTSDNVIGASLTCNCNDYGLYIYSSDNGTFSSVIGNSNDRHGLYFSYSVNNSATTVSCNRNGNYGGYLSASDNNVISSITCNNNTQYGIYFYSGTEDNTIINPICNGNSKTGIRVHGANNTLSTPICNGNVEGGIYVSAHRNTVTTPTCNDNTGSGLSFVNANSCIITTPTCNNNSSCGLYTANIHVPMQIANVTCSNNGQNGVLSNNSFITANNYSGTGNSNTDIYITSAAWCADLPRVKCQHFKALGDNRCYYESGVTYRDTADARSDECLKFDPSSATNYIRQNFHFRAASGVAQTLSAYIKDDASFNGDIQAAIYFMSIKITGWTEWAPTTSYVKQELVAAAVDITEDGVLELAIKVRGTAGNVFVDDLETA